MASEPGLPWQAQTQQMAAGDCLAQAMKVLQEVESLCQSYLQALAVGQPVLLSDQDMAAVIERFRSYGKLARAG